VPPVSWLLWNVDLSEARMTNGSSDRVLLVDNGSLEPKSTLQLRELAAALAKRLGCRVDPTSLAHSSKVAAEALGGTPAELFEAAIDRSLVEGVEDIVVVPLFIGPSHAVIRVLPALLAERKKNFPGLRYAVAPPLFTKGDRRLAEILADHVQELIGDGERPRVAIVDHGSPNSAVTEVRDAIAAEVRELLGSSVNDVVPCSMERREEAEYDFNEPLLATLLARPEWSRGPTIVGMLFIGAGRHAGPDGDVAQICRAAAGGSDVVRISKLLGEHPKLIEILADRARSGMAAL
jgi:sirohydrochlorin ferrochelatase